MYLHLEANFRFENNIDAEADILLLFRAQVKALLPVQVFSLTDQETVGPGTHQWLYLTEYLETDFKSQRGFELF